MAHTLKISFNSLENFNENFKCLKKSGEFNEGLISVAFAKNYPPQIEHRKDFNIGNDDVSKALQENGVGNEEIDEVISILNSMKGDVVSA